MQMRIRLLTNDKQKKLMKIKFTKMHGAGNDYIYVNTLQYPISEPEKMAVLWSRPHTGIGSDGLVLIGLALGLIAGVCVRPYVEDGEWLIPGFIMLGGGLGFVVYYLIAFKLRKKDGSEEDIA